MKTLGNSLRLFVVLWLVLGALVPALVFAQGQQPKIHIHAVDGPVEIVDPNGLAALRMTLDFTLLNDAGEVVPGVELTSATLDLEDGSRNPSPITEVDDQWSVALLADSSRTLFLAQADAAFKAAREDAIAAVGALPDGSNVGFITFDDNQTVVQDFTSTKETVQNAVLRNWKTDNVAVSCLYDAAFFAISQLSRTPGRRALIILTGSANSCARLPKDVIDLANENDVQIYGIAIRGLAAIPAELEVLANATGGLVEERDAVDINFAFQNITNGLNLQRRATATFFPLAGEHQATLSLVLPDNSVVKSDPVTLVAERDFESPPTLTIQGEVIFNKENLQVNLAVTSPALVTNMEASVIDTLTETPVLENFRIEPTQGQFQIPVGKLPVGGKFRLEIRAFNRDQVLLVSAAKEFTVAPVVPLLSITNVQPPTEDETDPAYVLTLQRENLEGLVKYRIRMVPNGTTVAVPGSELIVPAGITVRVPVVKDLPTGVYQFVVDPLAEDDTVLAPSALSEQFSFTAPDPRAIFFRNLASNPAAIAGISLATGLGCVGILIVLFFVISAARPRQARLPKTVDLALPEVKRRAPPPVMESAPMRAPSGEQLRPGARPAPPRRPAARPPVERQAPERPAQRTQYEADVEPAAAPAAAAGQAVPRACLTAQTPPELKLTGRITKTPYTIGRAAGNDLVVEVDNRVGVSGKHASIVFDKGQYFIVDQKSTYGTTLNDQRIAPNAPTPLEEGMLIGLGPKIKVKFSQQDCA